MTHYRKFDLSTLATPAIPATPSPSSSKVAGVAEGLSAETQLLAALVDACEGLALKPDEVNAALSDVNRQALDAGNLSVDTLAAFARALADRKAREAGDIPNGWNTASECRLCGPVWLWDSFKPDACPWCFNRLQNFPIPRPAPVTCAACKHFEPDPIGADGIGQCAAEAKLIWGEPPRYPNAHRWHCNQFVRLAVEFG